ncbi:MAG TPA: hybrid sensor histidine kinase/response regulator, partial [Isosphaeraceae bacterium]|nr:hybrid sensor histidine kinase/response regulator [Isosphaeraceae bacterium]
LVFMAKILLIDDSTDIRALVCLLLKQGGHTVVEAEDGRVGLDLVRETRPDLVLTDLALPGLSGWDITRILKSDPELAEIPIVALTAHAMRGDRERALATGCDGFIVKPIDDEKFEPTIRSYLKTSNARSESQAEPQSSRASTPPASECSQNASTSAGQTTPVIGAVPTRMLESDGQPRRILVVDDNPGVLSLMRQFLASAGFETIAASDGPTALRAVEEQEPELAVLDVMLPGLDGYQITETLKSRSQGEFLPVMLVTAGPLDRERGLQVGADDFLSKPIDRVELLVRVRSLLRLRDAVIEGRHQAEALRKLDQSKQRFIAAVVHDLRTPLNAMSLTLDALSMAPPPPDQMGEELDLLQRNIRQMDGLLTSLLDYSRAVSIEQPLSLSVFRPRDLIEEIVDSLAATASHRGLDLRIDMVDDLPDQVCSDFTKCRQVLFNLVSNALKYTERGYVEVRARSEPPDCWLVSVTDTGVGIA